MKLAISQWASCRGATAQDFTAIAADLRTGAWMQQLSGLCKTHGCGLTLGWAERAGRTAFDAYGRELGHYRKIQLFGPMGPRWLLRGVQLRC